MITNLWLLFLLTILGTLTAPGLLPVAQPLPSQISVAITALNGAIQLLSWAFPFDTLFQCFTVYLTIEGALWTFKWANFIINKIRGSG
jgi:hypothetical protein